MNSILRKIIVVATFALSIGTLMAAEPSRLSASIGADLASKYVWRGQKVNDDAVFQPSVDVSYPALGGTFGVNYWLNMDMSNDSASGGNYDTLFTESDLTVSYSIDLPFGSVSAGVINYDFPSDSNSTDTREVYGTYGISAGPVDLGLGVYYDTTMYGIYANLSAGTSFKLSEKANLGLSANVGWANDNYNNTYFGNSKDAWNDYNLGVSISGPVSDKVEGSIGLAYSGIFDKDLQDEAAEVIVTAGLSYSF